MGDGSADAPKADPLPPEHHQRQRTKVHTEYEFAVEKGLIEDGAAISRRELRAELGRLSHMERQVLRSRLQDRLDRLHDLMDGPRKTFQEPRATPEDLLAEVRLANQAER